MRKHCSAIRPQSRMGSQCALVSVFPFFSNLTPCFLTEHRDIHFSFRSSHSVTCVSPNIAIDPVWQFPFCVKTLWKGSGSQVFLGAES